MTEHRIKRVGDKYVVQAFVEVGIRHFLRRGLGLWFIPPRHDWRTYRDDTDVPFPVYNPYGDGRVLTFDTYEAAAAMIERHHQEEEQKQRLDALP